MFQLLLLKKTISTQLVSLVSNTPKPDVNVKIEFDTDTEKFQQALNENFGRFKKLDSGKEREVSIMDLYRHMRGRLKCLISCKKPDQYILFQTVQIITCWISVCKFFSSRQCFCFCGLLTHIVLRTGSSISVSKFVSLSGISIPLG